VTEGYADRELLFEALAVHLGFLARHALSAVRAERLSRSQRADSGTLGALLVERAALTVGQCALLEQVVESLLDRHGGDFDQCLKALGAFDGLRHELQQQASGGSTTNPTVPSIPVRREHQADLSVPGDSIEDVGFDHDDPELHGLAQDAGAALKTGWLLGTPTSTGMRFQVLRPHAQGGIGKVSVALDAELQREVALKQIKPERADDAESRARFLLEAEVTGQLEHPGIVPVYGLGKDERGRPFYVMRFVRGISFEEAIKQFHEAEADPRRDRQAHSLDLRHLLRRFADVCQTVAYAHSRGVLHRDLKPANVLLGPFNESLVVDWGLAKVVARSAPLRPVPPATVHAREEGSSAGAKPPTIGSQSDPNEKAESQCDGASVSPDDASRPDVVAPLSLSSSTETLAGTAFGTPAFMSPEQAEGKLAQVGPHSDVYSLGAILYTLLSGKPPFEHVWCDVTALLDRVRGGEFPPPHKVNAKVPRALEAVCLKAMSMHPQDRYASPSDLADEIERWLGDEPVLAYREPVLASVARWGRRHKPIVAGAAALLLTAVAALSAGILLLGREQRRTEARRREAFEQRALATANANEAHQKAESLRRRDAVSRVNLAFREYLDDNVALADELLEGCQSDLRAWEWDYARRIGHGELRTFAGASPGMDIWCVAFSPDGAFLAAGSGLWFQLGNEPKGGVTIRAVKSGAEVFSLHGLTGAVPALAFSPDGRRLAVARAYSGKEEGATLSVFDIATGRRLWEVGEQGVPILSVAYSPDGRTIATGCGEFNNYSLVGYARLLSAESGSALGHPITGGPGGVVCVAYTPDGRRLALASRDVVDIYDVASESRPMVHRLRGHVNFVYAVAFSPDGRRMATGGWDKTIRLWDPQSGALLESLVGHRGFVRGLAFSSDGSQLVSASEDKSVRRWDLAGGGGNATFHGHTGFVHCVAFSPDGVLCASGGLEGQVKLWPAAAPDSQVTFRGAMGWVGTLAFMPDGRRIASAHNGNIRIWDARTGEELKRIIGPRGLLGRIGLVFSPDGSILAASSPDGSVVLWDTERWAPRKDLKGPSVVDADFSHDGTRLATACSDGTIQLWDVVRGTPDWVVAGHTGGANSIGFAPDDGRVVSGGEDRKVRVWDSASGRELLACSGHATGVRDVAFSPDGRAVASVGGSYRDEPKAEVKIWDSATGQETASLQGHTSLVTGVAYFPDGRRIATSSDDRTVKLWDVATGEEVFTLRGHTSGVVSVAVSRDGRQIVSGSIDYTAKVWSTELPAEEEAFDLSLRRAAVERVQALFAGHMLKDEVLDILRTDKYLSPQLRAIALKLAEHRAENAGALYEAALLSLVRPGMPRMEYDVALRRLEAACGVVSDDAERLAEYRHALALAFYRTGQPERALETLRGLDAVTGVVQGNETTLPMSLAVKAMCNSQLGRTADARTAMEQLRKLMQQDRWVHNQEAVDFLREAEASLKGAR
jgi:WD40 repeat protein/serine/threonine protein kinase